MGEPAQAARVLEPVQNGPLDLGQVQDDAAGLQIGAQSLQGLGRGQVDMAHRGERQHQVARGRTPFQFRLDPASTAALLAKNRFSSMRMISRWGWMPT